MENKIQKNKEYIVDIIDNGFEGEGIAKIDGYAIFIPGAIKGEKVKILIVKVLTSHAYGKIIEIINPSENRIEADCKSYKRCGGCNLRHINYNQTLKLKQNIVQNLVNKGLKNKITVKEMVGMENPLHYRNKAQYPLGIDKQNNPVIGVFARRSHEIIPMKNCFIQNENAQGVAKFIFEFIKKNNISIYNEKTGKGLFRHIVIKTGIKTKQIMCILVINGRKIEKQDKLVQELTSKFKNIKSIVKNINTKNTNVIMGSKNITIYGEDYIEDILGKYTFKISPLSFYQVNPIQAEKLYNIGIKEAKITKEDIVFDLYCGIGTISIFMAEYAKKVYGVEIVEDAIKDAKQNAKINNVQNVEFIAGDTKVVLDDLINDKKIIPNIIMVDPPRKGLDDTTIQNILKIKPNRCIYISCNPATLIRDLAKFEDEYQIKQIQPVDMFPFTSSIEAIAVLCLKEK